MDVRHLELLRDLAERGSVTAVAAATHRTPSAVSQQLKTAQRELGVPLVEPAGRGLRLTEAGALLARAGVEVATVVEQVQAQWDEFRGEPQGTVSVAALPSAATYLLPAVLTDLADGPIRLRCSDIDIAEAEFGRLVTDYDIVIAHGATAAAPAGTDGLTTTLLVREPLDIALPAGHRLARRRSVAASEVVDDTWIGVPRGYPYDAVLTAIEAAVGRQVHVTQRLKDNRLIESLVSAGHGVALLPRFTTRSERGLVLRPLCEIPSARYVFAVQRPDKAERLAVRRVLALIQNVASTFAPGTPLVEPAERKRSRVETR